MWAVIAAPLLSGQLPSILTIALLCGVIALLLLERQQFRALATWRKLLIALAVILCCPGTASAASMGDAVVTVINTILVYVNCDWEWVLNELCGGYQACAYTYWYGMGCG